MELCIACRSLQHEQSEAYPPPNLKFTRTASRRVCGQTMYSVEFYDCTICATKWLRDESSRGIAIKWARYIRPRLYLNEDDLAVLAKQGIALADTDTKFLLRRLRTAAARASLA